jgi:hypothetical protein
MYYSLFYMLFFFLLFVYILFYPITFYYIRFDYNLVRVSLLFLMLIESTDIGYFSAFFKTKSSCQSYGSDLNRKYMLELSLLVQVHLPIFLLSQLHLTQGHVLPTLLTGCQKQETQFIFQVPKDEGRGGCNGDRTAEIQAFFAGNDASGQFYNV